MKLTIRILRNEEGGFTAVCPTLPGCITKGGTRQEAADRLDEAMRGYIAAVSNFVPEKLEREEMEV
ncbi:MAG: type II toxin-antitoxin system HicB family antitoxin [Phycisphaerae bacterium]